MTPFGASMRAMNNHLDQHPASLNDSLPVTRKQVLLLLNAQEEERRLLARKLHDHFGQTLTAAVLELEYAKTTPDSGDILEGVVSELRKLLADLRDLTLSLRPALLDEEGLGAALQALLSKTANVSSVQMQLVCDESMTRLPSEIEITAFRMVQDMIVFMARLPDVYGLRIVVNKTLSFLNLNLWIDHQWSVSELPQKLASLDKNLSERAQIVDGRSSWRSVDAGKLVFKINLPIALKSAND